MAINMDKRVLLVSTQKSFMVNAMIKNLSSESFDVMYSNAEVKNTDRFKGEDYPSIVLIYLDQDVEEISEFLIFDSVTREF